MLEGDKHGWRIRDKRSRRVKYANKSPEQSAEKPAAIQEKSDNSAQAFAAKARDLEVLRDGLLPVPQTPS